MEKLVAAERILTRRCLPTQNPRQNLSRSVSAWGQRSSSGCNLLQAVVWPSPWCWTRSGGGGLWWGRRRGSANGSSRTQTLARVSSSSAVWPSCSGSTEGLLYPDHDRYPAQNWAQREGEEAWHAVALEILTIHGSLPKRSMVCSCACKSWWDISLVCRSQSPVLDLLSLLFSCAAPHLQSNIWSRRPLL